MRYAITLSAIVISSLVVVTTITFTHAALGGSAKFIQIGVIKSSLVDVSPKVQKAVLRPLGEVVQNATGHICQTTTIADPLEIGRQLESGKLHFGAFNGHEFAYGVSRQPVTIPAFSEALLDVEVVSNLLNVMQQVQEMSSEPGDSLHYRLRGKISLEKSLAKLPFNVEGKLTYLPENKPDPAA